MARKGERIEPSFGSKEKDSDFRLSADDRAVRGDSEPVRKTKAARPAAKPSRTEPVLQEDEGAARRSFFGRGRGGGGNGRPPRRRRSFFGHVFRLAFFTAL